jgi:hypothetical protein
MLSRWVEWKINYEKLGVWLADENRKRIINISSLPFSHMLMLSASENNEIASHKFFRYETSVLQNWKMFFCEFLKLEKLRNVWKLYIVNMMIKQTCIELATMSFSLWKSKEEDEAEWAFLWKGWNIQLFIWSDCDLNNKDWFFYPPHVFTHIKCFFQSDFYCVVLG